MPRCLRTPVLLLFLTAPSILSAQTPTPREAGPERRVPFFAGDWNFTGELDGVRFGPDQPENRVTEHCEMLGDFFLTCRCEVRRSGLILKGLRDLRVRQSSPSLLLHELRQHGLGSSMERTSQR